MARCSGTKANGDPCRLAALEPQDVCWAHAPENAEKRKRAASKGGKSKGPNRELADIKSRLLALTDAVLDGSQDRASAAVAGQLLNTLIRCCGLELRVREVDELEGRLEELESLLTRQGEGSGRVS
jgi:hypothetical protein